VTEKGAKDLISKTHFSPKRHKKCRQAANSRTNSSNSRSGNKRATLSRGKQVNLDDSSTASLKDEYLFKKLNLVMTKDLKEKTPGEKVMICSKVMDEIVKRQDSLIAPLLKKVKQGYEDYIRAIKQNAKQKEKE